MNDPYSAVQCVIRNDAGQEVGRLREGEKKELPPGKYTVTYIPPRGYKITTTNPKIITLNPGELKILTFDLKPEDIQEKNIFEKTVESPARTIAVGAVTVSLVSSPTVITTSSFIGGFTSTTSFSLVSGSTAATNSSFQLGRTAITQTRPITTSQVNVIRSRLPSDAAVRFRQCVIQNAINLTEIEIDIEIPTRSSIQSDLIDSAVEASEDEFLIEAWKVYRRSEALQNVIRKCDLSLFQELEEAEEAIGQTTLPYLGDSRNHYQAFAYVEQPQQAVYVDGSRISVREQPHPDASVVGYVSYATMPINMAVMATLTPQERYAIAVGQGWYPVLLPNDQRGFVHSHYARLIQLNSVPYTTSSF